jgi:hypothetical protein
MYASRYSIEYSNITLISCTPGDKFGVNPMYLPTLAGMRSDLIEKVVDVTVPSYPVLPYMNLHDDRIKIDHAAMGRSLEPSTHLCSNTMKCEVDLPGAFELQTVRIFL